MKPDQMIQVVTLFQACQNIVTSAATHKYRNEIRTKFT